MMTVDNERPDEMAVTLCRILADDLPIIPAGELLRVVGEGLDDADEMFCWAVAWQNNCYFVFPHEVRPATDAEVALMTTEPILLPFRGSRSR